MSLSSTPEAAPLHRYPMAPLIRFTLISLYLALVLPLPVQAPTELRIWLSAALPLGLAVVLALVSEQVELSPTGIRVGHPAWCAWLLRRGWQLPWSAIQSLTPVTYAKSPSIYLNSSTLRLSNQEMYCATQGSPFIKKKISVL